RSCPPCPTRRSSDLNIGDKIPIAALLDARLAALATGMGAEAVGRRAGCLLQRLGRRRMVAMGMGDEDVGDPFVGEAGEERRDMRSEEHTSELQSHLT